MMREFPQRSEEEEKQTCESVPRNQDGEADNKDHQEQQLQSVYQQLQSVCREQSTMR